MKLRYFFDAGSGICLWSGDEATRDAYGYPVALENLPLSNDVIVAGNALIKRYDTCVDKSNPGGPSLWSEAENKRFLEDSQKFYLLLSNELKPQFEVVNEPDS